MLNKKEKTKNKLLQEFNDYKEKNEKKKDVNDNKLDELNKELSEIYEINEDYKKKIIMYKNKIKELSEIKENIDNDMDINYRRKIQEIEPNKENEKDKGEDLEFYKKSYEEQKFRVNEEHKLISESLYKLAVHFMSLKDDLQKKINNNNNK